MTKMENGTYRTAAGSTLTVSGKHGGIFIVKYDWLEENGSIECEPDPVPDDGYLKWKCSECGGGSAEWKIKEDESCEKIQNRFVQIV